MTLSNLGRKPSTALAPVLVLALLGAMALALDEPLWGGNVSRWLGLEVFKLILQFLLITVIGGGVFAYFAARRDEQARAELKVAELQKLDRELGEAYRATKRIKRSMRSKLSRDGRGTARIEAGAFVSAMDDILDAQIATEEVREDIAVRRDLLDEGGLDHLAFALRYAARYLHDVYEDYERGRVSGHGKEFLIDQASPNLRNFLLDEPVPDDLKAHARRARDDKSPLSTRFRELETFETARMASEPGARRHGAVAMECFRMSSAQIRETLARAMRATPYRMNL